MTASAQGTALVTGASSGIGAVYADRLAKRGYDLILVARNRDRLARLAQRLRTGTGRSVETIAADLGDKEDLAGIETRLRTDTRITLLVNSAGVGATQPLLEADVDKMDAMVQLNVGALTRLTYAVAPGFVAPGAGPIIDIASVVAISSESSTGSKATPRPSCWRSASRCSTSSGTRACGSRRCCRARPRPSSGTSPDGRCINCPTRSSCRRRRWSALHSPV